MTAVREVIAKPRPEAARGGRLRATALVGAYGYGFFAPWSATGGSISTVILLIAAIGYAWNARARIAGEPLLWAALSFVAYVTLRGAIAAFEQPAMAAEHWAGVWDWSRAGPTPVLVMAYAVSASGAWSKHAFGVLAASAAGTLITLARGLSLDAIVPALTTGARYTFDAMHSIIALQLVAMILFGLVSAPLLVTSCQQRPRLRAAVVCASTVVFVLFIIALIMTKSRSGWLALATALFVMAAVSLWHYRARMWEKRSAVLGTVLGSIVVLTATGYVFGDEIAKRFHPIAGTVERLTELPAHKDVAELGGGSLGVRVAFWHVAARGFSDKPLFGYGTADTYHLADDYALPPQLAEKDSSNFHSSYAEYLLSFGLVGAIPILVVLALAAKCASGLLKSNRLEHGCLAFYLIGFIVAFAVWGIANQRLHSFDLLQLYTVSLGVGLAPHVSAALRGASRDGVS